MKDIRGSHVSAVRNATSKTFGLQVMSGKRKNSRDVLEWKKMEEVKDSYYKLFNDGTVIENITISAFPSSADEGDERFSDMYIYTASVCDIILNPDNPNLEVTKPALELRLKKFKVFIEFILIFIKLN